MVLTMIYDLIKGTGGSSEEGAAARCCLFHIFILARLSHVAAAATPLKG